MAFLPLGNKAQLQNDKVFLLEHYKLSPKEVMELPSSERHRLVKIKEEFNRMASKKTSGDTVSAVVPTGLAPQPQRTVGLNYREGR